MSASAKITITTEVELTTDVAGTWFAGLNDEQQADFFVAVARAAENWPKTGMGTDYQWFLVGRHLRDCECSTPEARQLVRSLHDGLEMDE